MSRYNRTSKSPIKLVIMMLLIVGIVYLFKDNLLNASHKVANAEGTANEENIREVVRNELEKLLDEKPEIIISAIKKFQQNEIEKESKESNEAVKKHLSSLHSYESFPGFGPKDANNYIVQFFDYNCGYCQKAAEVLKSYTDKHNNTRVVLIDLPILGDNSVNLSKVAAAVYKIKPELYSEFYFKLINESNKNLDTAKQVAYSVGINKDDLETVLKTSYPENHLNKSRSLGMDIKVRGTPFLIVNAKVFNQGLDLESLENFVKENKL